MAARGEGPRRGEGLQASSRVPPPRSSRQHGEGQWGRSPMPPAPPVAASLGGTALGTARHDPESPATAPESCGGTGACPRRRSSPPDPSPRPAAGHRLGSLPGIGWARCRGQLNRSRTPRDSDWDTYGPGSRRSAALVPRKAVGPRGSRVPAGSPALSQAPFPSLPVPHGGLQGSAPPGEPGQASAVQPGAALISRLRPPPAGPGPPALSATAQPGKEQRRADESATLSSPGCGWSVAWEEVPAAGEYQQPPLPLPFGTKGFTSASGPAQPGQLGYTEHPPTWSPPGGVPQGQGPARLSCQRSAKPPAGHTLGLAGGQPRANPHPDLGQEEPEGQPQACPGQAKG